MKRLLYVLGKIRVQNFTCCDLPWILGHPCLPRLDKQQLQIILVTVAEGTKTSLYTEMSTMHADVNQYQQVRIDRTDYLKARKHMNTDMPSNQRHKLRIQSLPWILLLFLQVCLHLCNMSDCYKSKRKNKHQVLCLQLASKWQLILDHKCGWTAMPWWPLFVL